MDKILSICMPSYNMEKYIHRSMKSLLVPEILDALEIIIVNDGSKDKTLEIANEYQTQYPQSVIVIDKPNGHYGSCINAALKIATGKYFRILDTDDWFDDKALVTFVKTLAEIESEAVYTPYSTYREVNNTLILNPIPSNVEWNKSLDLNDYKLESPFLHMHCLTYKLSLFKSISYQQTEGVCYTDSEYVYMLLGAAKDLYCLNISLYQYFIGRDDQSMSPKTLVKNFAHFYKVLDRLIEYKSPLSNNNMPYLRNAYLRILYSYLFSIFFDVTYNDKHNEENLRRSIDRLKANGESLAFLSNYKKYNYRYVYHWYNHNNACFDYLFWFVLRLFRKIKG